MRQRLTLALVMENLSDLCSNSDSGYVGVSKLVDRLQDVMVDWSTSREEAVEPVLRFLREGENQGLCHYIGRDRWKFGSSPYEKYEESGHNRHHRSGKVKRKKHKKEDTAQVLLKQLKNLQTIALEGSYAELNNDVSPPRHISKERPREFYQPVKPEFVFQPVQQHNYDHEDKHSNDDSNSNSSEEEDGPLENVPKGGLLYERWIRKRQTNVDGGRHRCAECGHIAGRNAKAFYFEKYSLPELLEYLTELDQERAHRRRRRRRIHQSNGLKIKQYN